MITLGTTLTDRETQPVTINHCIIVLPPENRQNRSFADLQALRQFQAFDIFYFLLVDRFNSTDQPFLDPFKNAMLEFYVQENSGYLTCASSQEPTEAGASEGHRDPLSVRLPTGFGKHCSQFLAIGF
jgi:hypothetical protein